MKKKQWNRRVMKHVSKCTAVSALAFTMVLQLCFSFTSLASSGYQDSDYPYWDEPYNGSYSSWYDDSDRKLTDVTRTYDDGTTYTSKYKYNEQGKLISGSIKEPDGSKSTIKRTFNGEILVSETNYEYDADNKSELTKTLEYREDGYPSHTLQKYKYSDGTSQSTEVWYIAGSSPQKYIQINVDGSTEQTDYTYDEQGQLLTRAMSSSDGSTSQEEWQYDGSGEEMQYKSYEYDAARQTKSTMEMRMEGEGSSQTKYTLKTKDLGDGEVYKEESWLRAEDNQPTKQITTSPDGSQITESYTYNADGDVTLYIKNNSNGTTQRRETFNTKDGKETLYTDGGGNSIRTTYSYDKITDQRTEEETAAFADGSSSYKKSVTDSRYNELSYLYREKKADGTEIYTEKTYKSDGSSTIKEKTEDGTITVTEKDSQGENTAIHTTLSDGTRADTTWTRQEDGKELSEVTRYSDGTEDRIDYEYNESGQNVKSTETRRNGVSAVVLVQYNGSDGYAGTQSVTFNNGYQVTFNREFIDAETERITFTYSVGDVYQDIVLEKDDEYINIKTIYRDGRTEESSLNLDNYEDYYLQYEKVDMIYDRYSSFLEQAFGVLPSQAETTLEATPSDAEVV